MQYIYFYLISYSLLGYGIIISNYLNLKKYSFGYLGILGLTFLLIISFLSSIFINHGQYFNFLFLITGLFLFFFYRHKIKNLRLNFLQHLIVFSLLFLFITLSKNHDDFPYYHFPYIVLLTEFSHPFGLGLLNNGFRSPSSIFFLSSMFYLPGITIFIFHITPALILGYCNLILINNIFDKKSFKSLKFLNFISLISIIFVNIFFYRLAEHGTDRSGMILVIISVILFLKVINFKSEHYLSEIKFLIICLCFVITIKPFYLINIPLILLLLAYDKTRQVFIELFFSRTFYYCVLLLLLTIFFTFINSGCLFFPVSITCFKNLPWSLDTQLINDVKVWFELWSKAGATPNYVVEDRVFYISNFNWFFNWIDQYFFNKVSDFLLGLFFLFLVVYLIFKKNLNQVSEKKINFKYLYFLIILFIIEWFLYHPTLRYGGYHLIFLSMLIPAGILLNKSDIEYKLFYKKSITLIVITIIIFTLRNIDRIYKEYKNYNYNPFVSLNYKFFGGNEEFHFRYNKHLKDKFEKYNSVKILGKKFIYLSRDNF